MTLSSQARRFSAKIFAMSSVKHAQPLRVPYDPKPIYCERKGNGPPALIFTHGAGGTLSSDGIANFASGFAGKGSILSFQGNMNLKSRVKMFEAVIEHEEPANTCLGGRSMGSRAAVMAANSKTEQLILVSYPLRADKKPRDQILLDLKANVEVLFVIGDKDSMCDLEELRKVQSKMICRTWMVTVIDADHGMNVKQKKATEAVGKMTGKVAGEWLHDHDARERAGTIYWDAGAEEAVWSGWLTNDWLPSQLNEPNAEDIEAMEAAPVESYTKRPRKLARPTTTELVETDVQSTVKPLEASKPMKERRPAKSTAASQTPSRRSSRNPNVTEKTLDHNSNDAPQPNVKIRKVKYEIPKASKSTERSVDKITNKDPEARRSSKRHKKG